MTSTPLRADRGGGLMRKQRSVFDKIKKLKIKKRFANKIQGHDGLDMMVVFYSRDVEDGAARQ